MKEFIVDSINYLGWESNFFIRPPRVFKILSTKFQSTQTIERDKDSICNDFRQQYKVSNQLFVCGRAKLKPLERRFCYY